ncbi:hypothetical protein pipiens_001229 [Culex pipiens pipiens]|uniref:F-box domain-containing protein n=1 Tax=Culex pipiens pipiens TaxID=38569 RepID=A0ABD1DDA7_CULPP
MSNPNLQTSVLDPHRFPPELLEHIFRHLALRDLKSSLLVCRHWRDQIVARSKLMTRMVLRFPENRPLDRRHPGVWQVLARNVSFSCCSVISVEPWWATFGSKLVRIDLNKVVVGLPVLLAMLRQTAKLKELSIVDSIVLKCEGFKGNLQLNDLEVLKIERPSPGLLNVLKRGCSRLKVLHVTKRSVTDEPDLLELVRTVQGTLKELYAELTETLLEAISEMDQLKLTGAGLGHEEDTTLTIEFCRLFTCVTILTLKGVGISGSILAEIGQLLPNLKELSVSFDCLTIEPLSMQFLRTMPKLENLSLVGDPQHFKKLGLIHRSWCPSLKQLQLKHIALNPDETCQFLATSDQVKSISMFQCLLPNWTQFTQTLGTLPSLEQITMHHIVVPEWPRIPTQSTNHSVKSLKLKIQAIPKPHLETLINSFPKLQTLHLAETRTVDDATIQLIRNRMEQLRHLAIQSCPITEKSVRAFFLHPRKLEKLEFAFVAGVADHEVERLRQKLGPSVEVSLKKHAEKENYITFEVRPDVKDFTLPIIGACVAILLLSRVVLKMFK